MRPGWSKASGPLLYIQLSPCPVCTEGADPRVGTLWPWLWLAYKFQEEFRGCFLFVLNMEFLSPVVAALLLSIFDIKALSAATCYKSTGVWVGWVHLSPWVWGIASSRVWVRSYELLLMSYSRTPAMRTSMHWMGEMMGWESSKQFWLWLLLSWRILGRHCYLFESLVFSPFASITCILFMQERTMGKWLQKCPPQRI